MTIIRNATEKDLPALIKMLAEDQLGSNREEYTLPLKKHYRDAFAAIEADGNNELMVLERNGQLAGMLQLTFIPYLTHKGSWRCLIEGVRIEKTYRGMGLGTQLIKAAITRAREKSCQMVQLTSNKQRNRALRFYSKLGFVNSHEGLKLYLD